MTKITLNETAITALTILTIYILCLTIYTALDIGNIEQSFEITWDFPIAAFTITTIPAILGFILGYNLKLAHTE